MLTLKGAMGLKIGKGKFARILQHLSHLNYHLRAEPLQSTPQVLVSL
jgi:hypothetical protein